MPHSNHKVLWPHLGGSVLAFYFYFYSNLFILRQLWVSLITGWWKLGTFPYPRPKEPCSSSITILTLLIWQELHKLYAYNSLVRLLLHTYLTAGYLYGWKISEEKFYTELWSIPSKLKGCYICLWKYQSCFHS